MENTEAYNDFRRAYQLSMLDEDKYPEVIQALEDAGKVTGAEAEELRGLINGQGCKVQPDSASKVDVR